MIFITQIPRDIYESNILSASADYNANGYIISDKISIPCIKEQIDYNDTLDLEINQLNMYLPVTGSQVITPQINNSGNGSIE